VSRPGRERLGLSRQGWLWALAIVAGLVFSLGLPSVVGAGPTRSGPALSPRFSYDGPAASTTRLANARIVAIRGYDASREVSPARTRVWGAVSAAKGATGLRARLADETGTVRFGARRGMPGVDRTGKVHGELPDYIPSKWTRDELEELAGDLQGSIRTRHLEQLRLGEHGPHRARIEQERRLLRQIQRTLGGS
jgi:hypothetical protein